MILTVDHSSIPRFHFAIQLKIISVTCLVTADSLAVQAPFKIRCDACGSHFIAFCINVRYAMPFALAVQAHSKSCIILHNVKDTKKLFSQLFFQSLYFCFNCVVT